MSMRLTVSSFALATQTKLVPASMPPGRPPDRDRLAEQRPGHRVDPGDAVGAAVRDPDDTGGDGHARGPAADQRRRAGERGAEVDPAHGSGRGAAHPDAAGADREAQRRGVRGDPALEDPAPLGVDRGDPAAVLVGDPDPVAAEDERPGPTADRRSGPRPCRRRRRCAGPRRSAGSPPRPSSRRPRPRRRRARGAAARRSLRPVAESIRERVPSRALVTQTERSPVATRSGPWPIRDRVGDGDVVAAEELAPTTKATTITARITPAASARPCAPAEPLAEATPAGPLRRSPRSAAPACRRAPGSRRAPPPSCSRAASIRPPAVEKRRPGSLATARSITASRPSGISGSVSSAWRA